MVVVANTLHITIITIPGIPLAPGRAPESGDSPRAAASHVELVYLGMRAYHRSSSFAYTDPATNAVQKVKKLFGFHFKYVFPEFFQSLV